MFMTEFISNVKGRLLGLGAISLCPSGTVHGSSGVSSLSKKLYLHTSRVANQPQTFKKNIALVGIQLQTGGKQFTKPGTKMAVRRCHPWQCDFRALSFGAEREKRILSNQSRAKY